MKRVRQTTGEAELARAHQKKERDPQQISESQRSRGGLGAKPSGGGVNELDREWLPRIRRGVLIFVELQLPLQSEVNLAVAV